MATLEPEDDPIQVAMGGFGRWHFWMCMLIFLVKFPMAWHQMAIIFLAPPAAYTCVPSKTDAGAPIGLCSDECVQKAFDRSVFSETIITEFGLVCDQKHFSSLAQTLFMLGVLFGNLIFGELGDKFGRRGPLVISALLQLLASVASSFAPSYWIFCILRFVTAIATGGTLVTSFVIIMEIIGIKYRGIISVVYQLPFNIGYSILPAFSYFLRDWRYFQFGISIPSIVFLSYYFLIPESPRWLFAVNRVDDAVKVLTSAAKCNNLPRDQIQVDIEEYRKERNALQRGPVKTGNVIDLVRTPNLRRNTICVCLNWFVIGMSFFGVSHYIGRLGGNIFWNVAIAGSVGIPGTLFCVYCMTFGRKRTIFCSNMVSGLALIAIAFISPSRSIVVAVFAIIGITGLCVSFPTVYLYAGELFPTVVRNVGVGVASMMARLGSMIAPFIAALDAEGHFLPPIIFGIFPIIGAGLVLLLPETHGKELPDTIEDGENFGRDA